jgi:hypothetical protein
MIENSVRLDIMAKKHEDARRKNLVNAIKSYQIELAKANQEIVEQLGNLSFELFRRAHELMNEKIETYIKLQEDAKNRRRDRLLEIEQTFSHNERVRIQLEDSEIKQTEELLNSAIHFINELRNDINDLIKNIETVQIQSLQDTHVFLQPISKSLSDTSDIKELVVSGLK